MGMGNVGRMRASRRASAHGAPRACSPPASAASRPARTPWSWRAARRRCGRSASAMVRARGGAQRGGGGGRRGHAPRAYVRVPSAARQDAAGVPTPEEWCAYYGVELRTAWRRSTRPWRTTSTYHGGSYRARHRAARRRLGRGRAGVRRRAAPLPLPTLALPHPDDGMRFVACPVRLEDIAVHPNGDYRDKVKARGVRACLRGPRGPHPGLVVPGARRVVGVHQPRSVCDAPCPRNGVRESAVCA